MRPSGRLVLLVSLLVLAASTVAVAAVGGAVGGPEGTATGQSAGGATGVTETVRTVDDRVAATSTSAGVEDAVHVRTELAPTAERGTVGVRTEMTVPDRMTELRITLRGTGDVRVDADGFTRVDDEEDDPTWEWDGRTRHPALAYEMDANVTADARGPLAGPGTYRFVDAGAWAIVRVPQVDMTGRFTGSETIGTERDVVVEGDGVAGESLAFLGPHETYESEAADQRFRLIVPHAAEPDAAPDAVLEAFAYAATELRVGARDDEVVAVVAPGDVDWSARGIQIGDADLWVLDAEPAGTAEDVWTHEYVHTRQSYEATESARWFTEASATYYAALFSVERGTADFEEFRGTLAAGERAPDSGAVLAAPGTWERHADYTKGALVAGEIDRQLRVETDGEASLATVFRELNEATEPLTNEAFLDAVEAAAAARGDEAAAAAIRADAERFTTTAATPDMWDRGAHETAFGETPAQVGYGINDDGVEAVGEYRERPVDRTPIRLVPGETLAVTLGVSNTGGVTGSYEVTMTVDGEPIAAHAGTVEPGTETTERFEHGFTSPGEYEVRIGGETLTVVVDGPADVVVRTAAVAPDAVAAGESVDVTATLANDAGTPARADVEVRVDGATVATEPVRLDAGGEAELERRITLEDAGERTISVVAAGDESPSTGTGSTVTVDVTGERFDGTVGGTVDDVAGFNPPVVALAVVGAALLARRRIA